MRVIPVASTIFDDFLVDLETGYSPHGPQSNDPESEEYHLPASIDELAEFAGRNCYQAWERKRPETATNEGYLNNIINQGHFSVLEHGSVTFYVEGISRSLTHELIRHRHLSYSELSQRYVDMGNSYTVVPPAMRDSFSAEAVIDNGHLFNVERYDRLVKTLTDEGATRKEARQAARCVLPGGTETKIVVTGNLRAWRDVLAKRWHVAADAEIRELSGEILSHLRELAPNSVQDIPDEPYGS